MIILWGLVGALFGWSVADFDSFGFFIGGLFGLAIGWVLQRNMRAEVDKAIKPLVAQIDALMARDFEARDVIARELAARAAAVDAPRAPVDAAPPRAAPSPAQPATVVYAPQASAGPAAIRDTPPRAPAPPRPHQPSAVEALVQSAIAGAKGWLFGGNTIVRVGLIILFVGLSFLASWAASAGLFPIEWRLSLVALAGVALLVVGFRARVTRPGFGLALQGAGVAVLYLTLFAAAKFYGLFPATAAFVLMIAACALGCALALLQRSQALAVTSFVGGFAVPLLLSDGGGQVAAMFAYYTVLNLAILFIAHRQSWRLLNLVGFFATFGITSLWFASSYQPADFAATQAFVVVSVLIYVLTALLYTRDTADSAGRSYGYYVDTTLLFGPALAGFGLQVGLVHDRPYGSAFAALGFAALYLGIAAWAMRYRRESYRVMNETMLAIGIGFVTLAIPLALGARWTSAAWALEGAGAFWVGMRQARWMPRLFGIVLAVVAAFMQFGAMPDTLAPLPFANAGFVGAMMVALAFLALGWWLRQPLPHSGSPMARGYADTEVRMGGPAFLIGFLFWCGAWVYEVVRVKPVGGDRTIAPVFAFDLQPLLIMTVFMVSAAAAQVIGRRWRWPVATWPSHVTLAILWLGLLGAVGGGRNVLHLPDVFIWIAMIGLQLWMMRMNDRGADAAANSVRWRGLLQGTHIGTVWLVAAMLANALWLGIDRGQLWGTAWAEVTALVAAVAMLAALSWWAGRAMRTGATRWPLDRYATAYGWYAALPIAAAVYAGALFTGLLSSGAAAPLPYLPILNPVDLALGLSLAALELWRRTMLAAEPAPPGVAALAGTPALAALAGLAFVIVNTIWLRFAHHMLGVGWDPDSLLGSVEVQTGLAILWTALALVLMVVAHRRGRRTLWLVGAGLLGLTVAKLLLVDLNTAAGGARIIAFIVVGVLMLVVGYLAPLPPKTAEPKEGGVAA